jgi:hypothetical protein
MYDDVDWRLMYQVVQDAVFGGDLIRPAMRQIAPGTVLEVSPGHVVMVRESVCLDGEVRLYTTGGMFSYDGRDVLGNVVRVVCSATCEEV